MFRRGTLFIIGAGASCEIGLPSGDGLRDHIIEALAPERGNATQAFKNQAVNDAIVEAVQSVDRNGWENEMRAYRAMAERVRKALPLAQSIDNYLDAHRGNTIIETLGKIGIASSILSAEANSALVKKDSKRIQSSPWSDKLLSSWYIPFIQLLNAGRPLDEIDNLFDNVSFVIFNYDRCFEAFLVEAITAYYQIGVARAKAIIGNATIIHPYGKVGDLPWQGGLSVPLGGDNNINLLEVSREIRTFTETVDSGLAARIKDVVAAAETIVFMGFGFLEQNMQLMRHHSGNGSARRVFATTAGISDSDAEVVKQKIVQMVNRPIYSSQMSDWQQSGAFKPFVERKYCTDLMRNNWVRLTQEL
ncbi:hypothetical protein EWE75_23495 [Sphingomonas populi]|uniref:SIR2-like domain-containing protein n=1 Tax=Sphingomonas populi TaxID=2484750 RepID=A0A4Q6XS78_9SPHN|nr:hypothetical protein [Sphingomonas populi]RZF59116.1 hypothetical protein EWE75_23495 [Sphingomonas populi]